MWVTVFVGVVGGLGLFLYGMKLMAGGLQKFAGNKLKNLVEAFTSNRYMAMLVGLVVTMIIQSSSATSVMVVGFVNAGIMTLTQAVGIVLGANIGTTITGQMISFDLQLVAPLILGLGVLMTLISKKARTQNLSEILIGFGVLFIGIGMLKTALSPLESVPQFREALIRWGQNPIQGVLIGFILTVMVQSSSATIGVLIALASQGLISFEAALYIIYGDNIGTCTTALISSIGSSRNARRVAVIHMTFNVIGTLLFVLFLGGPLTRTVTSLNPGNISRQIANAHTIFNLVNVGIQLPFAGVLIKISEIIVPGKSEKEPAQFLTHLDSRMLMTPAIALKNLYLECDDMASHARMALRKAIDAFETGDKDDVLDALEYERQVNRFQKNIMEYLQELSSTPLSENDRRRVDSLFNTVSDIERIGDHAENIAELADRYIDQNVTFDEKAQEDAEQILGKIFEGFDMAMGAFREGNLEKAHTSRGIEKEIDFLEKTARRKQIKRMHGKKANIDAGIIFLDLLSNLERISDHSKNIAESLIGVQTQT
ncbi:MAG TPA: Na/Pi cotransporter family protein [Tissierellia bacterium]|nr:Na/Pi cotransporter family protein [Tissierellia bacterium]